MLQQLSLLEIPAGTSPQPIPPMDPESLEILEEYRRERLKQGASPSTVKRELSMLRTLARQVSQDGCEASLIALLCVPTQVATVLVEPPDDVAEGTVRARFVAFQRFVTMIGPLFGRNPEADLETLDNQLPQARTHGWHTASVRVGGRKSRRRLPGPTLGGADLDRIVKAAGQTARPTRDRLLATLHCFSGLRPKEVVGLTWEQFNRDELPPDGRFGLVVQVRRGFRVVQLLLPDVVRDALDDHASATEPLARPLCGPVFIASQRTGRPLGYRAARKILDGVCRVAGYPSMKSAELRVAYGHWLITQGLSDHETTQLLGIQHVRTTDRLLRPHRQLDAQRQVREMLGR
jgi:integrase